jgi:hypothetical protein
VGLAAGHARWSWPFGRARACVFGWLTRPVRFLFFSCLFPFCFPILVSPIKFNLLLRFDSNKNVHICKILNIILECCETISLSKVNT